MSKQSAQEFSETLKKTGETLKKEVVRKGLDKDGSLMEKIKKIDQGCQEAAEHIKTRIEK